MTLQTEYCDTCISKCIRALSTGMPKFLRLKVEVNVVYALPFKSIQESITFAGQPKISQYYTGGRQIGSESAESIIAI